MDRIKQFILLFFVIAIFFSGVGFDAVRKAQAADIGWCPCYSRAWPPDDVVIYVLNPWTQRIVPIPLKKHQYSCENEGDYEHYHSFWTGMKSKEAREKLAEEMAALIVFERL